MSDPVRSLTVRLPHHTYERLVPLAPELVRLWAEVVRFDHDSHGMTLHFASRRHVLDARRAIKREIPS